jgi:hypothetical protein
MGAKEEYTSLVPGSGFSLAFLLQCYRHLFLGRMESQGLPYLFGIEKDIRSRTMTDRYSRTGRTSHMH